MENSAATLCESALANFTKEDFREYRQFVQGHKKVAASPIMEIQPAEGFIFGRRIQ